MAKAADRRSGDAASYLASRFNREGFAALVQGHGGSPRPTCRLPAPRRYEPEADRHPIRAPLILEQIKRRIDRMVTDLKRIVPTHSHRSHLGGLTVLKNLSGAPVYPHEWEAGVAPPATVRRCRPR